MSVDGIVTHHTDTYASGVSRFNELLADHLRVPFVGLMDPVVDSLTSPLLSFKATELGPPEHERVRALLARPELTPDLYLHNWGGTDLEVRMVRAARRVWAGNLEVRAAVEPLHDDIRDAWTPGLLMDRRTIAPAEITVFSFGMAHKIQTEHFKRLRELLDASERSYAVYVSSATHATSSVTADEAVHQQMHELFPSGLWFLGNLSDVSVYNRLLSCTFFASFFPGGVRANNTSVAAALEEGAVTITNLDRHSPPHLRHGETVLDIDRLERLPTDALELKELSVNAMRAGRGRGWGSLVATMCEPTAPGR